MAYQSIIISLVSVLEYLDNVCRMSTIWACLVEGLSDLPDKKCCLEVAWKIDEFCMVRQDRRKSVWSEKPMPKNTYAREILLFYCLYMIN
jgi:hypothetical protein